MSKTKVVLMKNPVKQGLKPYNYEIPPWGLAVLMKNPVKQGLKH